MPDEQHPDQSYFDAQFTRIQTRIATKLVHQRRRRQWTFAGIGAVASLALTGGAIAIVQATSAEKSVSLCHATASVQSETIEVGTALPDGSVAPAKTMAQRVSFAEAQCGAAWQIGGFTSEGSSEETHVPIPDLFTCILRDGRLAVFPVTDGVTCTTLDLKEP